MTSPASFRFLTRLPTPVLAIGYQWAQFNSMHSLVARVDCPRIAFG